MSDAPAKVLSCAFQVFVAPPWYELLYNLLPWSWQMRIVARKLVAGRGPFAGADLVTTHVHIITARGTYRVMDKSGRVEPVAADPGVPPIARL